MEKGITDDFLRVYRFNLRFYFGEDRVQDYESVPAMVAAVTARGFEMWWAIRSGKKLIDEIGEASEVTVVLMDREGRSGRVIALKVADPDYLPFGVGVELGGQRVGRLHAMENEIALEGVVFRKVSIIGVEDVKETDEEFNIAGVGFSRMKPVNDG